MISRDSKLLYGAAALALFTYLSMQPTPTEWAYKDWIALGMYLLTWYIGKLQTSPLLGERAAAVGTATAKIAEGKAQLAKATEPPPGGDAVHAGRQP